MESGRLRKTLIGRYGRRRGSRADSRQWLHDRQLAAYQEPFSHYAKFTMEIGRAHADRRGWDYDWGEWSAVLQSNATGSSV